MSIEWKMGHGHVVPRPDGVRARCGGPAFCSVCQKELAAASPQPAAQPEQPAPTKCRHCGSTTLAGCNSMGCFAAESEQPEPGGLTDARISALWDESRSTDAGAYAAIRAFARAIEREVLATTRKRTAEQNARIMEAVDVFADRYYRHRQYASRETTYDRVAARAEVERLLRGEA